MEGKQVEGKGAARVSSNALVYLGVSALTILTIVVIGLIIVGNADSSAKEITAADGAKVTLTRAEASGRELFGTTCGQCHKLAAARTSGDIGPNLDQLRANRELVLNAIELGRTSGRGTMPGGLLRGQQAEQVADFVAAATN